MPSTVGLLFRGSFWLSQYQMKCLMVRNHRLKPKSIKMLLVLVEAELG